MLDTVWAGAAGISLPNSGQLADLIDSCMDLIPNSELDPPAIELPVAEDFGAAVAYSLRCLETLDPQEAAWAARRAYEAVDNVVVRRTNVDLNSPGVEERIVAHSLIQTELRYQEEDLMVVETGSEDESRSVVGLIRIRASQNAHSLF